MIGEGILNPDKLKSPPSLNKPHPDITPTKKVRVGGFFGQEVRVKLNGSNNNLVPSAIESIVSDTEGSTQVKENISITTLRPPRKILIKFCQICGHTLRGTSTCPICGFKN